MGKKFYSYPWQLTNDEYELLTDKEKRLYNKGDTFIRCYWDNGPIDKVLEGYELLNRVGYDIIIINSMGERIVTFHKPKFLKNRMNLYYWDVRLIEEVEDVQYSIG